MNPRSGWRARVGSISFVPLLVGVALIYGPLVVSDPLLERDDRHILAHLHGPAELALRLFHGDFGTVLGFQPLRDATYFLDLGARRFLGVGTFHLSNLLIWAAIVAVFGRLLVLLHGRSKQVFATVLLFAIHPVFVGSTGWVSARKHLLAALLILIATEGLIRGLRSTRPSLIRGMGVALAYSASLLAQPICAFWPLWALGYAWAQGERRWRAILPVLLSLPVMIAGAWMTFRYYSELYPTYTAASKWVETEGSHYIFAVLAYGRYVFNFILPVKLATVYSPDSLVNLIGLAIASAGILACLRYLGTRTTLIWSLYFVILLLPVTVRPTHIFVSDTYVLAASFGFFHLALSLFESAKPQIPQPLGRALFLAVLALNLALSVRQARTWNSDQALWAHAYAVEPMPRTIVQHARNLLDHRQFAQAWKAVGELRRADPSNAEEPFLTASLIHEDNGLSREGKIVALQARMDEQTSRPVGASAGYEWFGYEWARLQAEAGRPLDACRTLIAALAKPEAFGQQREQVLAAAKSVCQR